MTTRCRLIYLLYQFRDNRYIFLDPPVIVRGNVRERTATIAILIPIAARKMIVIARAVATHGITRLKPRAGMTMGNGTRAIVDTVMPMKTRSVGARSRRCQPRIAPIERTAYAKSDRSAMCYLILLYSLATS